MKNILFLFIIASLLVTSCSEDVTTSKTTVEEEPIKFLPFITVNLTSLKEFKETSKNWSITGNAFVDREQKKVLIPSKGTGLLVNIPVVGMNSNIFSKFEHGDIELELDVMMPVKSNSGIYFQGRYEVQLLDSWGKENPESGDMGGLYKRWDESKKEEKDRGFEGRSPNINAAKAPGLWQHFKIIFHAPTFDDSGNKVKNAWFEEVWLNGKLLHKNIEATGPSRAAAFSNEVPLAPLMFQGDHGPVAFRNIRYKLYKNNKINIVNLHLKEYESFSKKISKKIDTLTLVRSISVDTLTSTLISGKNKRRLLVFKGHLLIPTTGDYLFEILIKDAGGMLLVNSDTIINMDGDFGIDEPTFGKASLQKGEVPFTFIYNRSRTDQKGFTFQMEGPNIQKYYLTPQNSMVLKDWEAPDQIMLNSSDEVVMQRSFILHNKQKRTHSISVASPQKIHYAYDLALGSLLQFWHGSFLNVTGMWHSRGGEQTSDPDGVLVSSHGDPDFTYLKNEHFVWPDSIPNNITFKQNGYTIDKLGFPTFLHQIDDALISNKIVPSEGKRSLKRTISVQSSKAIWHKIGEGAIIEKLPDNSFAINDKSYFVEFPENSDLNPIIRNSNNKMELLIKIPKGKQELTYTIIW